MMPVWRTKLACHKFQMLSSHMAMIKNVKTNLFRLKLNVSLAFSRTLNRIWSVWRLEVLILCTHETARRISCPCCLKAFKMPVLEHLLCKKKKKNRVRHLSVLKPEIIPTTSSLYSSSAWSPLKVPKLLFFFLPSHSYILPQVSLSILYSRRCIQEAVTDEVRDREEACGWKRRITICKERRCQGLSFCLGIKQVGYKGQDKCR